MQGEIFFFHGPITNVQTRQSKPEMEDNSTEKRSIDAETGCLARNDAPEVAEGSAPKKPTTTKTGCASNDER
jgi:hypothetical protein